MATTRRIDRLVARRQHSGNGSSVKLVGRWGRHVLDATPSMRRCSLFCKIWSGSVPSRIMAAGAGRIRRRRHRSARPDRGLDLAGYGYDTAATVQSEALFTVHRHHENLDLRLFRSVVIFDCGPKDRNEDTGFLLANANERIVIVHASLLLTSPLELRLSEAAAPSLPCGLDV